MSEETNSLKAVLFAVSQCSAQRSTLPHSRNVYLLSAKLLFIGAYVLFSAHGC